MKGVVVIKETSEFENIYRTYYSDVFSFIDRLCGNNKDLAEELTQETFYQAFRSFHRYNGSCTILTWLCAIGKNIWFHYLRKHKNAVTNIDSLEESLCEDYENSPDAFAERSDRCARVNKVLSTLTPRYKEIIWLRNFADMPFARIAEIMDISENSAKVLYFRAKNQVKEKLQNEGFF